MESIWQKQVPDKLVITRHINRINDSDRRYRYHFSYKFAKKENRLSDPLRDNMKKQPG